MRSTTRINPDLPLCWETPSIVRIGFERAVARVHSPTAGMQRLIGSLLSGVDSNRLPDEARRLGATPAELQAVLESLRPVLVEQHDSTSVAESCGESQRPLPTTIADDGRTAPGLRRVLSTIEVFDIDPIRTPEECEFVIVVERFLEPLERVQRWRAAGIPHVLLRYTDRSVQVGPVVEPDGAPCHSCVSLSLVAEDPALPVLSIQLSDRIPQSETAAVGEFAAVYAGLLVRDWRSGRRAARSTRWRIPVLHGRPSAAPFLESVPAHPECGCVSSLEPAFAGRVNR
ncbi:MAG: hypothetical protein WDA07_00025 [Leucobacter sp.]